MRVKIEKLERHQTVWFPDAKHGASYNEKLLRTCIRLSYVLWEGSVDGELACMWGLIPPTLLSNRAYLWLYTTELIKDHQFLFVRHSQRVMEEMLKEYPIIIGHSSINADRSIRWLRWLGAEFGEPISNNLVPFIIRKKDG